MTRSLSIIFAALQIVVGATATALAAPAADQPRVNLQNARAEALKDEDKAQRLVISEAAYGVVQKNDTGLMYAAIHLQGAKTTEQVTNVFREASLKGDAEEVINGNQTLTLIKGGTALYGAGPLVPAVAEQISDLTQKVRAAANLTISDVPKEAAIVALYASFDTLAPELRDQAARELATMMGKDFEKHYVSAVREKRILGSDQKSYEQGIDIVNKRLKLSNDTIQAIAKGQNEGARAAAERQQLHKDVDHFQAGVFLTTVALGPIIGEHEARKVQTVGNAFVKMYDTMNKFGPGSITADKLLMCSNMVSAGMMVAQLFMKQEDPTMVALKSIMKQLEVIQKQLEQIDKKIDDLSNLVLVGFERILQNQQYMQNRIDDFSKIVLANIAEERQRDAIKEYLQYLARDADVYGQILECGTDLEGGKVNEIKCIDSLAQDLSGRTIFVDTDRRTTPKVMNPEWVNLMLSIHLDEANPQIVLDELSSPVYFMLHPRAFMSEIARDHEAVAAYSTYALQTPHPFTVPNPEILAIKLQLLISASRRLPIFKQIKAADLTDEALDRITEVEQFIRATIGNKEVMVRLTDLLGAQINDYIEKTHFAMQEVFDNKYPELRTRFLKGNLPPCPDTNKGWPDFRLPTGADVLVEKSYWAAQEMGLGQVQMCYETIRANRTHVELDPLMYFTFTYRVKFFFKPVIVDPMRLAQGGPLQIGGDGTVKFSSRIIASSYSYTTQNNSTRDLYIGAWAGDDHYISEIAECRPKGLMAIPTCDRNSDKVYERFVKESNEELPADQQNAALDLVKSTIIDNLMPVVASRSRAWDATELAFDESAPPKILVGHPIQTSATLQDSLKEFTKTFLLAQDLLLLGFYHGQSVSNCAAVLSAFSPAAMPNAAVQKAPTDIPLGDQLKKRLYPLLDSCLALELSPELLNLRKELNALKKAQLAN